MALTNTAIDDVRLPADVVRALARQVRAEYDEMPGLSVTLAQARRLWNADAHCCEAVFSALTASGFLKLTTKGRYVRSSIPRDLNVIG